MERMLLMGDAEAYMRNVVEDVAIIAVEDLDSITGGEGPAPTPQPHLQDPQPHLPGPNVDTPNEFGNPPLAPPRGPFTNPQWKPGDPIGPLVGS
jgi:hypothetical protein